jgi:hypothetical protein
MLIMVLSENVIKKIRKLRVENGLSIRMIGKKLHCSPITITKYIKHMEGEETGVSNETRAVTLREKNVFKHEPVDNYEMLDTIISEITSDCRRPGIVRMVAPYLSDPRKSLTVLAKALTIAEINPHEKEFILRNWANYVGIKNINDYIRI